MFLRTLRAQIFFGSLGTCVLMLALTLWNAHGLMSQTLRDRFEHEAQQVTPLLQAALVPLLLARDYATLEAVVRDSVVDKGLGYLEVSDGVGLVARAGRLAAPSAMLLIEAPLAGAGQALGRMRVGIRTETLRKAQLAMLRNSLVIGAVVLAGAALLLWAGTHWLTAGLRRVAQAARRLEQGDQAVQLPDSPVQEVQQVSAAFNRMAQAVRSQLAALQQREGFQAVVIDTLAEGLIVVDAGTRQVVLANDAALRSYQLTREQLLGRPGGNAGYQLLDAHDVPLAFDQWPSSRVIHSGQPLRDQRLRLRRIDGSTIWVSTSAVPLRHPGSDLPYAVLVTFTDIDAQMRAELELRALAQQLELRVQERTAQLREAKDQAEQASLAKSEFLSRMSHELRTPLNAILGFAQLLGMARGRIGDEDLRKVRQIEDAGWHLLELINEVLDLARIEAGQMSTSMETLDLVPLLLEAAAQAQPQAARGGVHIDSGAVAAAGSVWARGDRKRLRQVLANLVSNAVKYNHSNGRVSLRLDLTLPGRVGVEVRDTGRGFTPEQAEALFQPFTRFVSEQEAIEGTGIGLVITRRLVELMGGRLTLQSTPGAGSVFRFDLAGAAAPEPGRLGTPVADPVPAPPEGRRWRLVYVEDNPSNVALMRELLRHLPQCELAVAEDGPAGLAMIRSSRPDLAIVDIHLPGMDGIELCTRLKADETTRHLPLLALTANAMPNDVARARAAGFDGFLTKPLEVGRLLAELQRLLEG